MFQRLGSAALLLVLALSSQLFAAGRRPLEATFGYVFPTSANVQGDFGAFFKTRMVVTNPDTFPLSVQTTLNVPGGGPTPPTVDIALQGRETKVYENFLEDVFGYTGAAGISFFCSTGKIIVTAEVYVESRAGRYSTPLPGLTALDRVFSANPGGDVYSVVIGLRVDSANRANFGCTNTDPNAATIKADVYAPGDPFGRPSASIDLALPGHGWAQQPVPAQGSPIRIVIREVSGGGASGWQYCYGVNVNNASNDGTLIPAVTWDLWDD
jgi:hypothetical protein